MTATQHSITKLPVMEMFYSIQGEGFNTGTPAYFIRLAGCDVGCHWCDVKDSWDAHLHKEYTLDEIAEEVNKSNPDAFVITGGEPAMYDLNSLCKKLKTDNQKLFLETSGAYLIKGNFDWICISPKKFKSPLKENLALADELKVIVFNKTDFEWAEENAKGVNENCKLYLQPEWSVAEKILPSIIEYVKENPKWKISLQTHKYIGVR